MSNANIPSFIIDSCKEYINDQTCVYKLVRHHVNNNTKYYLVIMSKIATTITNETSNERKHDVIDPYHASYRASELNVKFIINIHDPTDTPTDIWNTFKGRVSRYESVTYKIHYKINEIVVPHRFDFEDCEDIYGYRSGGGIYYFKTIETAYFYSPIIKSYTGKWFTWKDNGEKYLELNVIDGKIK